MSRSNKEEVVESKGKNIRIDESKKGRKMRKNKTVDIRDQIEEEVFFRSEEHLLDY